MSSYGGFWGAWAAIQVDSFGIVAAYGDDKTQLRYALGIFLIGWFIFTFFLMLLTVKSTVAFFLIFFFLSITFLLLAISEFSAKTSVKKAGGVFGLITAFVAWYNAYAGIANPQNSYLVVKAIPLPDLQDQTERTNKRIRKDPGDLFSNNTLFVLEHDIKTQTTKLFFLHIYLFQLVSRSPFSLLFMSIFYTYIISFNVLICPL